MKQILVFLTLIGLLLVNLKLNAQVEYYNEKNPRPEGATLYPTMKNAHKGTNFSVDEVRLAHLKGLNTSIPLDQLHNSYKEFRTIEFAYYSTILGETQKPSDVADWVSVNFPDLGGDPELWQEKSFPFLEEISLNATDTIVSLGYLDQDAYGSKKGMKSIERAPYRDGQNSYRENEKFLGLPLEKLSGRPEFVGVYIVHYSLGCGNAVMLKNPQKLKIAKPNLEFVETQQATDPGVRYLGSDWVVSIEYYTIQQPLVQMAPQNFNYCGVSYQWGFNYNPCWWSPAVYYPTNCWGCTTYVPQQPVTNNYYYEGDTYITNEGDTYITNEGDQIINEGDVVIVNNNPPADDDDGGPVLPPNGDDDDGGPVLGENGDDSTPDNNDGGPNLGENGPNLGNNGEETDNGDNNGGGGNLGGSGMIANDSDSKQTQKTVSFSDISPKVQSEYWNSTKQSLVQKETAYAQNQSSNNTSKKPANWNVQNTSNIQNQGVSTKQPAEGVSTQQNTSPTLSGNSTKQPAGTTSTKPANWNATANTSPAVGGGKNPGTTNTKPQNTGTTTAPVRGNGTNGTTGNNSSTTSVRQPAQGKPLNWNATANTSPAVGGGKNPGTTNTKPQNTGTTTAPVRGNGTSGTTYKPSQNTTVQRGNGGTNTSSTSGKLNTGNYQTSNNSGTTSQSSTAMKGSNNYSGGKVSGGNTGGMRSSGGGSGGSVGGGSRGGRR